MSPLAVALDPEFAALTKDQLPSMAPASGRKNYRSRVCHRPAPRLFQLLVRSPKAAHIVLHAELAAHRRHDGSTFLSNAPFTQEMLDEIGEVAVAHGQVTRGMDASSAYYMWDEPGSVRVA